MSGVAVGGWADGRPVMSPCSGCSISYQCCNWWVLLDGLSGPPARGVQAVKRVVVGGRVGGLGMACLVGPLPLEFKQ